MMLLRGGGGGGGGGDGSDRTEGVIRCWASHGRCHHAPEGTGDDDSLDHQARGLRGDGAGVGGARQTGSEATGSGREPDEEGCRCAP